MSFCSLVLFFFFLSHTITKWTLCTEAVLSITVAVIPRNMQRIFKRNMVLIMHFCAVHISCMCVAGCVFDCKCYVCGWVATAELQWMPWVPCTHGQLNRQGIGIFCGIIFWYYLGKEALAKQINMPRTNPGNFPSISSLLLFLDLQLTWLYPHSEKASYAHFT